MTDPAVHPSDPNSIYCATGQRLWKAANNGRGSGHLRKIPRRSIGTIAIDPTLWVRHRRNQRPHQHVGGDGVSKPNDGGRTWAHMGLRETRHIGRVLVDPRHRNAVLIGA
ncbi:MAG: hypothetical protein H0W08_10990 [Acidobacteria bacterium]|nr:hypothetical protein [Acidobacteriota bacterium]